VLHNTTWNKEGFFKELELLQVPRATPSNLNLPLQQPIIPCSTTPSASTMSKDHPATPSNSNLHLQQPIIPCSTTPSASTMSKDHPATPSNSNLPLLNWKSLADRYCPDAVRLKGNAGQHLKTFAIESGFVPASQKKIVRRRKKRISADTTVPCEPSKAKVRKELEKLLTSDICVGERVVPRKVNKTFKG